MLSFREFLNESSESSRTTVKPKKKSELIDIIEDTISEEGFDCDLNFIDTSAITDMSELFNIFDDFNGDISKWDVSEVENMSTMFAKSKFNGDISKWDVSNVKDMSVMFAESKFNGDISKWDVSNVRNMACMFNGSNFNGDISKWDVSNVETMDNMFKQSDFEGNEPDWYKD